MLKDGEGGVPWTQIPEVEWTGGPQGSHVGQQGEAEEQGLRPSTWWGLSREERVEKSWLWLCELGDGYEALRTGLETRKRARDTKTGLVGTEMVLKPRVGLWAPRCLSRL